MKSKPTLLFAIWLLSGCAAVTKMDTNANAPAFLNKTKASDTDLMQQWVTAQRTIASSSSDLNPATRITSPSTPARIVPPDPRAMAILPRGVSVVSLPDIPVAQLVLKDPAWSTHTDPSGVIDCGVALLAHSCVDIRTSTVQAAESLVPQALEWEFENIILNSLGYDVSGR